MENADGYVIYDAASGEIRMGVGSLVTALANKRSTERILNGRWDDSLWCILNGVAEPRPKLFPDESYTLPADGVTTLQIADIPVGTMVKVNREPWIFVQDGRFEFVSAFAGEWRFEVLPPFPFQAQLVRISVHEN